MAKPKRHHFLPKFLLRGFASFHKGQHYLYRFPRHSEPHSVNIINVAVGGKFHEGIYGDIEAELSTREGKYSIALDDLRHERSSEKTFILIAELIFNIMIRTKNIRDGMTEFGNRALLALQTPKIEQAMRKYVYQNLAQKPEIKAYLASIPKSRRERALSTAAMKLGINFEVVYRQMWSAVLPKLQMEALARNAQLKSLVERELPEPRKESFLSYRWYIDNRPIGTFVLGDVGPIARTPGSSQLTFPYGFGTPTLICLPISSSELLVGTSGTEEEPLEPDEVNMAAVELSRDFFVASQNTRKELDYVQYIGARAEFIKEDDALRLLSEAAEELLT